MPINNEFIEGKLYSINELELWRLRSVNGPFRVSGDTYTDSLGEWTRIDGTATAFGSRTEAQNTSELITQNTGFAPVENLPSTFVSSNDFTNWGMLRDAALVDLLENTSIHSQEIKRLLLLQVDAMPWGDDTLYPLNNDVKDYMWYHAEWMHRVLKAYDFLDDSIFTTAEKTLINTWFIDCAEYFNWLMTDRSYSGQIFTTRSDNPENSIANINHVNFGPYSSYQNGVNFYAHSSSINNRRFGILNFITAVGIKFGITLYKDTTVQIMKEYLAFHWSQEGYFHELERSDSGTPSAGLGYCGNTLINVVELAHYLRSDGYFDFYSYSTFATWDYSDGSIIIGTVEKSLEWVLLQIKQNFIDNAAPSIYPLNDAIQDSTTVQHFGRTTDPALLNNFGAIKASFMIANNYYNNPILDQVYSGDFGNILDIPDPDLKLREGPQGINAGNLFQYTLLEQQVVPYNVTATENLLSIGDQEGRILTSFETNGEVFDIADWLTELPAGFEIVGSVFDEVILTDAEYEDLTTPETITINITKPITSISVGGEIIDFTAYTGDLAALNPNVVFSVSDESAIAPYLTTLWSTGETTESIEVTPTEAGELTRSVTVDDGVDTATDTETVTVLNELPMLVLTADDEEARAGQEVTFTAASNVDVTFSSTDVVLVGTGNTRTAIMPVLPISNTVAVTSTATNLDGVSVTESIEITVDAQIVANAGADQTVITGDIVTVIGGYAGDALNIPLVYTWRIVNDPTGEIVLGAPNGSQTSFTTNGVGLGDVILGLTIGDGFADSEEDLISVSINDTPNLVPTADAGDNQTGIYAGAEFQLRAIAIDGDGVISSYEWTQVSGDTVTLSDTSIINPVGIAPISSTPQTLVFEVVAIDERGGRSAPSQVSVGVNAATSTAVVTITGLSDGDYFIKLISDIDDSKIFSGIATFENNEARVITTALSGTPYFGRFLGTPPEDGTGLYGVTE